jgi:hypothetical protein
MPDDLPLTLIKSDPLLLKKTDPPDAQLFVNIFNLLLGL